ncbi:uncharacterized protein LOC123368201 [Mauremys mutica]|uniref:uncharacterized protein LOC123368201 n=1 Tax=Mauremys mutica TaxID=74926 RepID=UPI001D16D328|nr:uncharacterized protein LOC123368201 [Mauremys mutica]
MRQTLSEEMGRYEICGRRVNPIFASSVADTEQSDLLTILLGLLCMGGAACHRIQPDSILCVNKGSNSCMRKGKWPVLIRNSSSASPSGKLSVGNYNAPVTPHSSLLMLDSELTRRRGKASGGGCTVKEHCMVSSSRSNNKDEAKLFGECLYRSFKNEAFNIRFKVEGQVDNFGSISFSCFTSLQGDGQAGREELRSQPNKTSSNHLALCNPEKDKRSSIKINGKTLKQLETEKKTPVLEN